MEMEVIQQKVGDEEKDVADLVSQSNQFITVVDWSGPSGPIAHQVERRIFNLLGLV